MQLNIFHKTITFAFKIGLIDNILVKVSDKAPILINYELSYESSLAVMTAQENRS